MYVDGILVNGKGLEYTDQIGETKLDIVAFVELIKMNSYQILHELMTEGINPHDKGQQALGNTGGWSKLKSDHIFYEGLDDSKKGKKIQRRLAFMIRDNQVLRNIGGWSIWIHTVIGKEMVGKGCIFMLIIYCLKGFDKPNSFLMEGNNMIGSV